MFDNQIIQHFELLYLVRGRDATLTRGGSSCSLRVVLGRANNGALTREAMKFEADCQDFLCLASEYSPGGTLTQPTADDTITVEIAEQNCVFEVRPASDSQQVYSSDPTGSQDRIHTKLISKS